MATDNEQLVLSISADTRQIQRQLKSLVGQTQANTKAIEDAFKGIDKSASGAFNGVAANSNRAFGAGVKGAQDFERAMNGSRVQTANLAAQINDIGVQLAGGQSPFLIALQQGSQINQVLGQGGARGAVGALAGAFTSLINPVSLATIAIIAGGGALVQYFTELLTGSEEAETSLKEQEKIIRSVAERWGDAIPPLKEYVENLDRAKEVADVQETGAVVAAQQWEIVRDAVAGFVEEQEALISVLNAASNATGSQRTDISDLGSAWLDLQQKVKDGTATQEDFDRVRAAATRAAATTGVDELEAFGTQLGILNAQIDGPLAKLQQLQTLMSGQARMLDPRTWRGAGLTPSEDGNIQNPGFMTPEEGPFPARRPLIELEGLPETGGRKGRGRDAEAERIKREKEAVVELIAQLEHEQSLIGMTAAERAEANALRRAGSAATDEQRAKISALVEATYAEREAIKASEEAMRDLQDIAADVLGGLVDDLRRGVSGANLLANALSRVADRILDSAFDFSGATGGKGKGLFGGVIIPGILHKGGVAGRHGYGHGRAVPSSVFSGAQRYHSGTMGAGGPSLRPGEVPAILERGEIVLPKGSRVGGTTPSITFAPQIDARGASAEAVARLEAAMDKQQRDFAANVLTTMRKARKTRDWQ